MRQIIAKADGVPLFVEELTKAVLESGLLTEDADAWHLDGPLPPLAIPSSLHDSFMARLDRMAPVKEVAQVGPPSAASFPRDCWRLFSTWARPRSALPWPNSSMPACW